MASSPPIDARSHVDAADRERITALVGHSVSVIERNQATSFHIRLGSDPV